MSSLPTPKLDDRTFEELLADAKARVRRTCPDWTDLGPHDPGTVLLEVFAFLTETLLYRVNRLPEKAYVEFLRLIGVRRQPPSAARAALELTLERPAPEELLVPRGTRVSSKRGGASGVPAVFTTTEDVRIERGAVKARAVALHCELVDAEDGGKGTGLPGQGISLRRPPVIAPTGDENDLVVAVEVGPDELSLGVPARREGDKVYRVWREVESFAQTGGDPHVYVADRLAGIVLFAPVASRLDGAGRLELSPKVHGAVPPPGRVIRLWYRRGGGPDGNLPARMLEVLKDPIPGLRVTNPEPATGGRGEESLENALVRGPEEIHSLRRAVTARDFETLAMRGASGIARAHAVTQAELWSHAPPGTVEVLLVPELPPEVRGTSDEGTTAEALRAHQTELARARIQADLDARRPMGTRCVVSWARLKTVAVKASLLVSRTADGVAIRSRALARLHALVNPLPTSDSPGWAFGEPLARSSAYYILQSEPGVLRVNELRFDLEEVPSAATALAADAFQPATWYAGEGERLFRSMNDGEGWEVVARFEGEAVARVAGHPSRPGLLAVGARLPDGKSSRLHLSSDCGETWSPATHALPAVQDLAWTIRDGVPLLLLATDAGLFELALREGATPLQVVVDPAHQDRGFWAVAGAEGARGTWYVAAAALEAGGVFLSERGGAPQTFEPMGLEGEDVRVLEMQGDGSRTFLWAGLTAASGNDPGKGCRVRELTGAGGWTALDQGWDGGSCRALAFSGARAFAATHRGGILTLDSSKGGAAWTKPELSSGLPLREKEKLFQPVAAVASLGGLLLAAGPGGLFRSADGSAYRDSSGSDAARELLRLPSTWLFCSGKHEVEVRSA